MLLITGVVMWLPEFFGRTAVAIGYVLHGIAAIVMLAGFIIHVYEGTAQQPGTFRAMTRGTVTYRWAWTHHPGWYAAVTGRDPRADQPVHAGNEPPRLLGVPRLRYDLDRVALAIHRHQPADRCGLVLVQEADPLAFIDLQRRNLE